MIDTLVTHLRTLSCGLLASIVLATTCFAQPLPAQNSVASATKPGEFVNGVFKDELGDHKYVVFVPGNYTPTKKWPVILFLHGACNRGTDGRSQLVSGLAPAIRLRNGDYPFLVVFPQCEDTKSRVLGGWTDQPEDSERAVKILDAVEAQYSVDVNRECLVGLSMGGTGVWKIAAKNPKRWAALVPVSAMSDKDDAAKLSTVPSWVFHAQSDPLVATHVATDMVDAINATGGRSYFTEVSKRAHDLSNVVFTQTALTEWLLDPSKAPNQDLKWDEPKGYDSGMDLEVPFVAGAEMTNAVRLRICKDVIDALCHSAPEKLAQKPMAGSVGGMQQSSRVGLMNIDVALSGVNYQGQIERVQIVPKAPNRLIVYAGLRNLTMTISNSQLNGRLLLQAEAGPINVVIGHREPVWLSVEFQPYVKDHRIHMNAVGMNFQIPDHNWYVTRPSDVYVRGMPFLRDRVSDGLVNGIYSKKGEIERQVLNSVPRMVQNLETKMNDVLLAKTVSVGQISMPIWQPRMKNLPENIEIDDNGLTLTSTVILSTLGQVPKDFKMRKYTAPAEFPPAIQSGAELDIAETVVPGWSDLIIAGGVNRFNVFDFTPVEYHQLADRELQQELIHDLRKYGDQLEVNVDFRLRDPIHLLDPDPANLADKLKEYPNNIMTLSLSSVPLNVSMRLKGETKWKPVGELDLRIDREYIPFVSKSGFALRGPKFGEHSGFRIVTKWKFDESYMADDLTVNEELFLAKVLKAREAAQLLEGVKPDSAQDVVLNGVPLRMDNMDWVKKHLVVQYQLPGLIVRNDSKESIEYEICGPSLNWGKPRTLKPGEFDEYRVPYPLTWRRRTATETQMYKLTLGNEFSYQTTPKPGLVAVNRGSKLSEELLVPR